MEEFAKRTAFYLSSSVEIVAAAVIALALLRFIWGYCLNAFKQNQSLTYGRLRVQFGTALALALELLLAADILITAVAPSWEDIGKLAAIAAIRTALNYFLEIELQRLEKRESEQPKGAQTF